MKVGVNVNARINGADLTLKTINNPALATLTQPEAKELVEQLVHALRIATGCDMATTEVLMNNHAFERRIDIQPG